MKLLFLIVVVGLLVQSDTHPGRISNGVADIINSANTIAQGVGKEIITKIPSAEELFSVSKQILFGLPEKAIFSTISSLCASYMAANTINPRITPDMDKMALSLRTSCKQQNFPLSLATEILESPDFDLNKKVVIFVTGWMSSAEADYVTDMANAFSCRGDYNFLALDTSDSIDTLYTWSAYNTKEVGQQLALGLAELVERVPVENIHLIGHSLGAHIVGYAGRYFTEITELNLTRITGLDPANPCFNEGSNLSGLQRGDADFVDVIHSNPGALGKSDPLGDVDFYPEGLAPIKPGCTKFSCSHGRAYEYFIESVYLGNEENFLAVRCTSLARVKRGSCKGDEIPMGYAVPYNAKGNYFLSVNAKAPFGQNHLNKNAVPSECRKCDLENEST